MLKKMYIKKKEEKIFKIKNKYAKLKKLKIMYRSIYIFNLQYFNKILIKTIN